MGEAILSAVLDKHLATVQSVTVSDISPERRQYLEQEYNVTVTDDNRQAAADADIVVLAIKPQNLTEVMAELEDTLTPEQLVLSIIAGARLDTICQGLGHRAYLFLFVEALVDAAIQLGLSLDMAQELVLTTVLGSSHLIEESDREPAELRRMVTSPGGTTAEALRELEQGNFADLLARAVRAAYERAKQLGS